MANESDEPIYRFTPQFDGAHMTGLPQRDLTQRDVDRLDPATIRRATAPHPGYGTPLYTAVSGGEVPKWFLAKFEKAQKDGIAIPPMDPNETQKAYEDRVAAMQQTEPPAGDGGNNQEPNEQQPPEGGNQQEGGNEPSGDGEA